MHWKSSLSVHHLGRPRQKAACHKNLVTRSSWRTEQIERLWPLLPPQVPPRFGPLLRVALLDILEKYVHREGLKQNKFACCLIRKLQFIVLFI